jgi:type II secretory pathway component PulJ
MIDTNDFQSRVTQLQTALSDKMRVRGATLERQLRRAEHRLPRRQRHAAATILGAQDWMAHPKLARVLDLSRVNKAFSDLDAHLARIDPVEERKTALLRLIGVIVIRLMGLAALIYAILRWRGLN